MDERYVFKEFIINDELIKNIIKRKKLHSKREGNSITLIIMGHGRERYKENFKTVIERDPNAYSEPFIHAINQQSKQNSVRILSKAGKPKICAWDYAICTKNMSSQDIILELSQHFFSEENKIFDTLSIMNAFSSYFKTIYPSIIEKISRNYIDEPEEKNPGSPDAEGYSQRYRDFIQVIRSLREDKFSDLKSLNHEKIFSIRPDDPSLYDTSCERYLFEIVELRDNNPNNLTNFIIDFIKIKQNLVQNYFDMDKSELDKYIENYKYTIHEVYLLDIPDYEKYYITKFLFNLYFGYEIMLSEIVEFFIILGIDTINIIDNTCRVKDSDGKNVYSLTPLTEEIESQERLNVRKKTTSSSRKSKSTGGTKKKTLKRF
jgi:hypothetical protein